MVGWKPTLRGTAGMASVGDMDAGGHQGMAGEVSQPAGYLPANVISASANSCSLGLWAAK